MADSPQTPQGMSAQERYDSLQADREPFLNRAREAAKYTIPALMPPTGTTGASDLYKPFQSLGAQGVNNLSAKMLLALFPPGSSFFRMALDEYSADELSAQDGKTRQDFEDALAKVERAVMTRLEEVGARVELSEVIKQLIASGNVLVEVMKRGKLRVHLLHSYVVKRDYSGAVLEIVTKQTVSKLSAPPEVLALCEGETDGDRKNQENAKDVDIYTRVSRTESNWTVHQEVCGKIVPGTEGTYPLDTPAFIALRFTALPGEDYGRGHVEEYIGDLMSLESLSQSIVEFAAVAAKILFFVDEAGVTSKAAIARTASGGFVDGKATDVTVLQLEKSQDFSVAKTVADDIARRLAQAFLMNSSVQRDAERVTAEEIRYLAQELEQTLGGVYSVQAQELQRPLVGRLLFEMQRTGDLPALPKNVVRPEIITGVEALGRGADLTKLDLLISGMDQLFGQEVVAKYINPGEYSRRRATSLGIDVAGLIRTDAEVQQMTQQQTAQSMAEKAIPGAMSMAQSRQEAAQTTPAPEQQ